MTLKGFFDAMQSITEEKNLDTSSMVYLHLVGKNKLQNDLLIAYLSSQMGWDGNCSEKLEAATPLFHKENGAAHFVLLDWTNVDKEEIWSVLDSWKSSMCNQCFFAFFNVNCLSEIEKLALSNNIQGIFYDSDSLDIISRGIRAILGGELWFSRETLTKCILENSPRKIKSGNEVVADSLTAREKEILALIASAHSNREIADKLYVSFHTIKTHIYHIYQKIKVTNRIQATLWAAKHL